VSGRPSCARKFHLDDEANRNNFVVVTLDVYSTLTSSFSTPTGIDGIVFLLQYRRKEGTRLPSKCIDVGHAGTCETCHASDPTRLHPESFALESRSRPEVPFQVGHSDGPDVILY
jgi:hypothetical protein